MALTASDLISYYRPSECGLRIYLRQRGEEEEPASAFEELLTALGKRHERSHLSALGDHLNLSTLPREERITRTKEAVAKHFPVIYQACLTAVVQVNGKDVEVLGEPDFLLLRQDEYVIRDAKIALRINEKDHPEILLQLQLYGWLFDQNFGKPPSALEVYSGKGNLVPVPYDKGVAALKLLETIDTLQSAS